MRNRNDNDLVRYLGHALRLSLMKIASKEPPIASKDAALIGRTIGSALRSRYSETLREPLPETFMALLDELDPNERRGPLAAE